MENSRQVKTTIKEFVNNADSMTQCVNELYEDIRQQCLQKGNFQTNIPKDMKKLRSCRQYAQDDNVIPFIRGSVLEKLHQNSFKVEPVTLWQIIFGV